MPGESLPWPGTSTAPLPPAGGSPIAIDFKCVTCGYNLRGLSSTSSCPECALPIADSVCGGTLTTAAPEFRSAIIAGLACLTYATLAYLPIVWILIIGRTVGDVGLIDASANASLAVEVFMLAGVWLLASPDTSYHSNTQPRSSQRTARVAAVVIAALIAAQILIMMLTSVLGSTAPLVAADPLLTRAKLIGWAVLFYAAMDTIEWIVARVPLPKVARRCTLFRWIMPVIPVALFMWTIAQSPFALRLMNAASARTTPGGTIVPPATSSTILLWPVYAGAFVLVTPITVIWLWWTLSTLRAAIRKVHARAQQQPPANGDPAVAQPQPSTAST